MSKATQFQPQTESLEAREVPAAAPIFAVGGGSGSAPRLEVYNVTTGVKIADFLAYESTFTGGVQAAVGDVNNDGFADVIVGAGVGGGPRVRIFDGRAFQQISFGFPSAPADGRTQASSAIVMADFFAFESTQRGGTTVATGNFLGSTNAEVVVGAGPGGGPRVRILDGQEIARQRLAFTSDNINDTVANFFAFESTFRNGVTVSASPSLGEKSFLVVAPGVGGGPRVRVLDGTAISNQQLQYAGNRSGDVIADFFVGDRDARSGLSVTTGDFNQDGVNDVAVGTGPGQVGSFTVFNGVTLAQGNFTGNGLNDVLDRFTYSNYTNGVSVGTAVVALRSSLLIVGTGGENRLGRASVFSFSGGAGFITRSTTYDLLFDPNFVGGVFVSQ
jgi:FG-GAP repeat